MMSNADEDIAFQKLLDHAEFFAGQLPFLAADGKTPYVEWDDFPDSTILHLVPWGELEYRAAILLLRNAEVAAAAEMQLRGVLELFGHVAWICGYKSSQPFTSRCRAICFELGMARTLKLNYLEMDPASLPQNSSQTWQEKEDRFNTFTELHNAEGCKCQGRTYRSTDSTLRDLSSAMRFAWIKDMWMASSMVVHQQVAPQRVMHDAGQGITEFVRSSYFDRAKLLAWLVTVYANLGLYVLTLLNPGKLPDWDSLFKTLRSNSDMIVALDGQMD